MNIFRRDTCLIPELKYVGHNISEIPRSCNLKEEWGYLVDNIWYFTPPKKIILPLHQCFYRAINRIDDFKFSYSDFYTLKEAQMVFSEVFEVNCKTIKLKKTVYESLFVQIVSKNMNGISKKKLNQYSNLNKPLNIILLSFDSVSRVSWLKRLKRTNEFIFNTMKFELLKGYNIVGDGTPAGLIQF